VEEKRRKSCDGLSLGKGKIERQLYRGQLIAKRDLTMGVDITRGFRERKSFRDGSILNREEKKAWSSSNQKKNFVIQYITHQRKKLI